MLTEEQLALRDGRLTASRVACIVNGDEKAMIQLWEEMVGIREEDNSIFEEMWAINLGNTTETLNLDWWAKKTGHDVIRRGEVVIHREHDWMACTLDGWDQQDAMAIECKHVGGFEPPETIIARYQPQMHWIMMVTSTTKIGLSVIYGAKEPVRETIELDKDYAALLLARAEQFMEYVNTFTRPFDIKPIAPPIVADVSYDMTKEKEGNRWADSAATWLEHSPHIKKAQDAEKELKGMMPVDAKKAHGNGVVITRNKAGSLSLRKDGTDD